MLEHFFYGTVGAQYPVTGLLYSQRYVFRAPATKGASDRGAIHPIAQSHKYEPPPSAT